MRGKGIGLEERDAKIASLYAKGISMVDIARFAHVKPARISLILKQRGILPPPNPTPITRTMWEDIDDHNRLRRAIWKRQREAAKAALRGEQP